MSTETDLLARLDNVLDYQALQQLFAEIAAQAHGERTGPELAKKIDDVIRRIEEERAADQKELDGIKERYDAFQQQNRGVVGWFKRHIPFTEARRQDVHHRTELADQQAEVLADNLVIARAQMLKERFLPTADRRMGRQVSDWQAAFDAVRSATDLPALATVVKSLATELARSRTFVELIEKDVEAFAAASFASKEDRARRDEDLVAARQELKGLKDDVDREEKLKRNGLKRLGELVTQNLTVNDSAFRDDVRQLAELEASLSRLAAAGQAIVELAAVAQKIASSSKELQSLPEQLQLLRVEHQQADRRQSDAAVAEARKTAVAEERRIRIDDARRRIEQAQQSLAGAQQADAAWHAQQKSMAQMVEAAPDASPHAGHLAECRAALTAAQAGYQEASQSFEVAKRDADQARAALEANRGQLSANDAKIAALEQRRIQLQHDLPQASLAGQSAFAKAAAALHAFLSREPAVAETSVSPPYGCVGGNQLNASWGDSLLHPDRDFARHLQAIALLEQLNQWQRARQQELGRQRDSISARRTATWKRRCSELVGDSLAAEIA